MFSYNRLYVSRQQEVALLSSEPRAASQKLIFYQIIAVDLIVA